MKQLVSLSALLCCAVLISRAAAHEVRPAYLELRQTATDTYDVLWKVPAMGDQRFGVYVRFPDGTTAQGEPRGFFREKAYIERSRVRREGGLEGQSVHFDGLSGTNIDVLVRIEHTNGVTQTTRVMPALPSFVVETAPSGWNVIWTYLVLGIEHILIGIDHLLFVLALVLLVAGWKRLVGTITAFTVAHSITLAAATLGFVHVSGPPVEACIALSIVFVAAEIIRSRQGNAGLTERAPWVVAFTFGLLHGFGFAGALSEIGLPQQAIPLSLLFFNVGVEFGQLFFVGLVLGVSAVLVSVASRLPKAMPRAAFTLGEYLLVYTIGGVAAFWVIERTLAFIA